MLTPEEKARRAPRGSRRKAAAPEVLTDQHREIIRLMIYGSATAIKKIPAGRPLTFFQASAAAGMTRHDVNALQWNVAFLTEWNAQLRFRQKAERKRSVFVAAEIAETSTSRGREDRANRRMAEDLIHSLTAR